MPSSSSAPEPPTDAFEKVKTRFYVWWYLCIAAGFLLLAIRQVIAGGEPWGVAVRVIISAGFALLAYVTAKGPR
jgi:hypothetical protein